MAYDDPQLLHADEFLTGISVAYDQENPYIGDQLFKTVEVKFQSDKYRVYNKDNEARVTDDHRSPGARANELPPAMLPSEDSYFATEHALKDVVPMEEEENSDPRLLLEDDDPFTFATERLTDTILLNREYALLQMILATANYATGHSTTLSGTAQWSDYTNSDPAGDIKTGRKKVSDAMGETRRANTVVIGSEIWWTLEDHPKVVEKLGNQGLQMTTEDVIAKVLRIDNARLIRATAEYNTAPYGQPANMVDLWGKHILMAWVPPSAGKRTPAFGYEFVWPYKRYGGQRMLTKRWWDDDRESQIIKVSRRYDQKFIAIDGSGKSIGGYLIKNVTA